MNAQEVRWPPLRGYRRRKNLPDLNAPPIESGDLGDSSNQNLSQGVQISQPVQPVQPAPIDIEAIDDDVVESSPRAFAEAKNNLRRTRGRTVVVDLDSGRTSRFTNSNRPKRRRNPTNQPVINCEEYINLESSTQSKRQNVMEPPVSQKEPTFTCPICMGSLVEEMSTRCGHIFCKKCIKSAISVQAKCPTCRKRVTMKELIRVFLPSTSAV
ncbi:hypothetical protein SLA2020_031160 [Shorea laevis]